MKKKISLSITILLLLFEYSYSQLASIKIRTDDNKTDICLGDSIRLFADSEVISGPVMLTTQWSPADLTKNLGQGNNYVKPIETTKFIATVTDITNRIVKKDSITIKVFECDTLLKDIYISFKPAINNALIDSIVITNLKTKQTIKLFESESLLISSKNITVLPNFPNDMKEGYLYPNPCNGDANLVFSNYQKEEVEVTIHNVFGQLLAFQRQEILSGTHRFHVKFPTSGIYYVSLLSSIKRISCKVVCTIEKSQICGINYEGYELTNSFNNNMPIKSTTTEKIITYTFGDRLRYSVFSGKNNTIITDSPTTDKIYRVEFFECTDPDKNSYPIVKIGKQWWMAKNLAYLPYVSNPITCFPAIYVSNYYGTDVVAAKKSVNYKIYGALYNWYSAMSSYSSDDSNPNGVLDICPVNWHLPSDDEWEQLAKYISDTKGPFEKSGNNWFHMAKYLGSTSNWYNDGNGTDDFGFSGLPGGYAIPTPGNVFGGLTYYGHWWSCTNKTGDFTWQRHISHGMGQFMNGGGDRSIGFSVRCIKD